MRVMGRVKGATLLDRAPSATLALDFNIGVKRPVTMSRLSHRLSSIEVVGCWMLTDFDSNTPQGRRPHEILGNVLNNRSRRYHSGFAYVILCSNTVFLLYNMLQ